MSVELFTVQAAAAVTASASGVGVTPTFLNNVGFNATTGTHTAVGVYNLDLDQPLAAADAVILATPRSAGDGTAVVGHTSDTRKQVSTFLAGVASDAVSFDIVAFRRPSA